MNGLENIAFDDGDLEAAQTYLKGLKARGWVVQDEYWDDADRLETRTRNSSGKVEQADF